MMKKKDKIAIGELLPKWQSHKIVGAAKILKIEGNTILLEGPYPRIEVPENMFARYIPVPGDYYITYDDGYTSISPAKAFEEGYHRI